MRTVIEVRPGSDELAIEAHFVSDKHRLVKHHAVDGYRAPPSGALRRETASGEIHLCEQPSAENVTVRISVGRHRDDAYQRQRPRQFLLDPVAAAARVVVATCDILKVSKGGNDGEDDNRNGIYI